MKLWGLLATGIVMGLIVGLVYTWVIAPPEYYDTLPMRMHEYYRRDWIRMTALAYGIDSNLERAQIRLQGLPEDEIRQGIAQTLDDAIAAGRPILLLQHLSELARNYGANTPAVEIYAPKAPTSPTAPPPSPTPTATPQRPTPTVQPTLTPFFLPSPTPALFSPYTIISQTLTCTPNANVGVSLVISQTTKVRGRERVEYIPVPGHIIWLLWEDGADRAITGFKPDQGLGYADFEITPGRIYKLYMGSPIGLPISTIQSAPCAPEEGEGWITRIFTVLLDPGDLEEAR
ncbi:MAG: hypothetical protein JXA21_09150 [Anaerolineae bacterium]|nr:hypothetical protein [Anaerolineae bacterium]